MATTKSERLRRAALFAVRSLLRRDFLVDGAPGQELLHPRNVEEMRWVDECFHRPRMTILLPVYDPPLHVLRACLESVLAQVYRRWELCIVDDGSTDPKVSELLREYQARDRRIQLLISERNHGIAATINKAAEMATGLYCGVLDHDDELSPWTLFEYVRLLNREPEADCIYCDEDKIDEAGSYFDPWHKTDWNPDLALSFNYVMHFAMYRQSLWNDLSGVRECCEGSQDYDLLLRASERTTSIHHIPQILYHWRVGDKSIAADSSNKPVVFESGIHALEEALLRRGIAGSVEHAPEAWLGVYRVRREVVRRPSGTAVVAFTGDQPSLLRLLASLRTHCEGQRLDVVIAAPEQIAIDPVAANAALGAEPRWARYEGEACFPVAVNAGSRIAEGGVLLFLDERTELLSPDSYTELLQQIQREAVGAVGGKLFYENGLLEHAGVILGPFGVRGYSHRATPDAPGYVGRNCMIGNFSAVMGCGMMTRRELFDSMGGFAPAFGGAYADADYCLRLRERGYLITYTPYSRMLHHVPVTPIEEMVVEPEATRFRDRWQQAIDEDPFYNPNLSKDFEDFRIVEREQGLGCLSEKGR